MKKRLITSALPYVNNIPHLGNLIQVLSADVFARFCRLRSYETLYVCGSDEYGTATETRAREEGLSPRELCDRNHQIHKDIYSWFNINFDYYGRTATEFQTRIVQDIFLRVKEAGYITQRTIKQLYSEKSGMFLADRYVKGECPHCHYDDARGDQCENCGKLLDPEQLINPLSIVDNSTPILRETTHFYINLPKILPLLEKWLSQTAEKGRWARNAVNMTRAWIRDGLKERAITRDLKWGIPLPLEGFEDKVFYVWFDAPIGYISISADYAAQRGEPELWKKWWQNPDEVELFQFIGKDNIPFHTVIFPSTLLTDGRSWTMLHHMSSTEYMNYEEGKFSKSKGVGVFGNDARETGIPADVWRFSIFYNRPETGDYMFTWKDFQEATNKELIGNLANLVNRTLRFSLRFFEGRVALPTMNDPNTEVFWKEVRRREAEITACLEWAELKDALRKILALADYGNKVFQESEPWKLRNSDPEEAQHLLSNLIYLIRDIAILVQPYIPETAARIASFLGADIGRWDYLASFNDDLGIRNPEILFQNLDDDLIDAMRARFSGNQSERSDQGAQAGRAQAGQAAAEKPVKKTLSKRERIREEDADMSLPERFAKRVELRVAKITAVERHPNAEKLYVATLNDGRDEPRTIVSGLVPNYRESELLNRNIVLVANLKAAKFRGLRSNGMLLAVSKDETIDVIFADHAQPGDRVLPSNDESSKEAADEMAERDTIDIDTFFDMPLRAENYRIMVGNVPLKAAGKLLCSEKIADGQVG